MKSTCKRVSIICGIIGLCCIVAAGLFALYNLYDDTRAAKTLKEETRQLEEIVLPRGTAKAVSLEQSIVFEPTAEPITIMPETTPDPDESVPEATLAPTPDPTPEPTAEPTPVPNSMPLVTVDGWDYVAIISIPKLDLEFCVRNEWTKDGGKKSPCRYTGSVYTDDLIICAHNYTSHFGRLKELAYGDQIILVDMDGVVYTYHVADIEEIGKYDITGMVSSGYDLSLFTCTIGGKARVTVRCTRDS